MLVAYEVSLDLIRELKVVVPVVEANDGEEAQQMKSAANSIVRNIAEGMKRKGRDPKRFYAYAAGSANEVRGVLDLADAWGWNIDVSRARQLADRLVGLLWGLTH